MVLRNLQLINTDKVIDIHVTGKYITKVSDTGIMSAGKSINLLFENAMALPGLINSHDHLDFNLFPQLGNRVYDNYTQWAFTIHKNHKAEIDAVLQVPEDLRVQWGVYKNLLCGVTTVVNHGKTLTQKDYLITVVQSSQCLHSVGFEKRLELKLNNPLKVHQPVAIHTGEGTDEFAAHEIDHLIKWNLLNRKLVGVHGVAMNMEQAKRFEGLVWCPASNYFLLNKTADIHQLKEHTTICFGSDSTLTSSWNIWDHIRLAQSKTGITSNELLRMLTTNPANVWKLNAGASEAGKDADIVVVKNKNDGSLFDLNPEEILLVIHKGEVRLFDDSLFNQLRDNSFNQHSFSAIEINNTVKHVKGNIQKLVADIKNYYPEVQLPINTVYEQATV